MVSVDKLQELLNIANSKFAAERYGKIEKMYEFFKDRILLAPASGVNHYHNAYAGGYLDHVLNVIEASYKVASAYKAIGGDLDFTEEEMVFAGMHHDLGKLGDLKKPYYIPNPSDWHVQNRGEIYAHSADLSYMQVPMRSLFLLQHFGIPVTQKEWYGIQLSDGLYNDANAPYMKSYKKLPIHTNLHLIVHWADNMASSSENDRWRINDQKIIWKGK